MANFAGEKFTYSGSVKGVKRAKIPTTLNSGAGAILLAQELGASRITLVGYDGHAPKGNAHWHANHPGGLGNAGASHLWPEQFKKIQVLLSTPVINCSRSTAIRCFTRGDLDSRLALESSV